MSPDEDTCPHCGAVVRPDAPWCTLCLTSLRPEPPAAPELPAEPQPATPVAAPVQLVGPAVPAPTIATTLPVPPAPRRGRHAADPVDVLDAPVATEPGPGPLPGADVAVVTDLDDSVDVMLSMLRAEHAQERETPFAEAMSEPGAKVMVIFGGMAVLTVLGLLAMFVVGHFV